MESSLRLFSVRGIDIRMHITFPLVLVWAAFTFASGGRGVNGAIFGIIVTLILFAIVVLHELGHSFVALEFDVPIKEIVLLPIGGVAQLKRMPDQPRQELLIAIGGPAVNFAIAILLAVLALALGYDLSFARLRNSIAMMGDLTYRAIFGYVFISNLFLGVFNLLPAFPMDGGRVLRALLAQRLEYSRATSIAVAIGQAMSWLLGLLGFMGYGFFLIVIAIFIYLGAAQEGRSVQFRRVLSGLTVDQAYSRRAESLSPTSTLKDAVQLTLSSFQANFPICEGERLIGLLTQKKLIESLNSMAPETLVGEVMTTEFQSVSPQEGLFRTQQLFEETKLEALPVVEEGRFLGLITTSDMNEIYRLASRTPGLLRSAEGA